MNLTRIAARAALLAALLAALIAAVAVTSGAASAEPPPQPAFDRPVDPGDPWPRAGAVEHGFDAAGLSELLAEAARTKTDALLIIKDGKLVVDRTFGARRGAIETMSATKSVVSIAVGLLIDEGKIPSVDAPMSTWFPSWRHGQKAKVTLRHVLTQSSGLRHDSGTRRLNQHRDRLAYARNSPLRLGGGTAAPGTRFSYNNEATLLLSGVIHTAAGVGVDAYLAERLFRPLGITDWRWRRDPAGNVLTHTGLALSARDLAKIGQLMLQGGVWEGRRLISERWVSISTAPSRVSEDYGFLWWIRRGPTRRVLTAERRAALHAQGFAAVAKLAPLVDRRLPEPSFWMEVGAAFSSEERADLATRLASGLTLAEERPGQVFAFAADGWLGQALIVSPVHRLIVVRQHRKPRDRAVDDDYNRRYGFFSLAGRLRRCLAAER